MENRELLNVCEVKLTYQSKIKASDRYHISKSEDVYEVLRNCYDEDTLQYRETFKILLINQANKVLGVSNISEGGITETGADIRLILQAALLGNATAIILSHNHPSGNIFPSSIDKTLTSRIIKAAELMNIRVLDHIIITSDTYYSFADEGMLI